MRTVLVWWVRVWRGGEGVVGQEEVAVMIKRTGEGYLLWRAAQHTQRKLSASVGACAVLALVFWYYGLGE
jgi:hypothetical protein